MFGGHRQNRKARLADKKQIGEAAVGLDGGEGHGAQNRRDGSDIDHDEAAYPDPGDKTGRFVMVDVVPVAPVPRPVTLAAIKADGRFADLLLVRQARLSVLPVSAEHWKLLCAMGGVEA